MAYPLWMLLYFDARELLKLHQLDLENMLLRIRQLPAHDNMNALMKMLPEFKNAYNG